MNFPLGIQPFVEESQRGPRADQFQEWWSELCLFIKFRMCPEGRVLIALD